MGIAENFLRRQFLSEDYRIVFAQSTCRRYLKVLDVVLHEARESIAMTSRIPDDILST